jgi:hypothetical protein
MADKKPARKPKTGSQPDPELNPDEILVAEFEYIAASAFQANEDRARVASFYFVSVGSLVAAILGTNFVEGRFNMDVVRLAFGGLFLLLTALGFLTILQLARLRAAWYECALAMNKIKEYYFTRFKAEKLESAFKWKSLNGVHRFKVKSVSFYLALEVVSLSAVMFGASVFFFEYSLCIDGFYQLLFAFVLGLLIGMVQLIIYWRMLYEPPARTKK